jgi:DUF4097 and DUF4098 domain-containing protein YvlB
METSAFSNAMSKFMNRLKLYSLVTFAIIAILMFGAQLLAAQAADNNRITVPLTDPSRPAQVRAHLLSGSITVKAYDGKDVIVEAKTRGDEGDEDRPERRHEGNLKRIPMNSTGLNVEAENNQVRISTDSFRHAIDLTLTVPVHTSLSLKTVNNGNITVTGVDGELDVDDINGEVTLKNISGSAVAHALNGKVLVTFNRVDPQKLMAFSSLNGDIDVTFPADIKATLSMRTDNGEVYSDFDIQPQTTAPQQTTDDRRGKGGKYVVRVEKTVKGTINGGGQEIQLKNFNGNIYIRKAGGK